MDRGLLPPVGFGTWPLVGNAAYTAVRSALDAGYRYIDTAMIYDNEGSVGRALRESGVPRDEVMVASKLPRCFHGRQEAVDAVSETLGRMGLEKIDLYLIHWPNPDRQLYRETWRGLLEARDRGLVESVGVCNFTVGFLQELLDDSGELPFLNQVELNPYHPQKELRQYHEENGILTQAWSPLGRGGGLLTEPAISDVVARNGLSAGEVILRWHASLSVMPLPRSGNLERQKQNLLAVQGTLESRDLDSIDQLDGEGPTALDPTTFVQRW